MEKDYIEKVFSLIDKKREAYETFLKTERSPITGSGEGPKMALDYINEKLRKAGASVEPCSTGRGGASLLSAHLGKYQDKKTVLFYAHLSPSRRNGDYKLFGNGMSDARGPLLCLFAVIDLFKELNIPLPVNIRFILEAMTEKDSDGFKKYLHDKSGSLFDGVDFVTILDNRPNYYYGVKPLLCWGLRGICKYEVKIDCSSKNLNCGENGGAIQEAMTDMVRLLSSLVNTSGDILIPNINSNVAQVTPQEEKDFHKSTFDVNRYKTLAGANTLLHKEDKKRVLMHLTRFPSLTIHSVQTANGDEPNENIPKSVTGTFSIRIVPDQDKDSIDECVTNHLQRTMSSSKSSNKMTVKMTEFSHYWEVNPNDINIQSCLKALRRAYKEDPELVREGTSIPILHNITKASGRNVLLLPIGRSKCHVPNITDFNIFQDGVKTISAYFYELSKT